ncbi:MAG: META domain-containing protein [Pseudomonadota bacterium]
MIRVLAASTVFVGLVSATGAMALASPNALLAPSEAALNASAPVDVGLKLAGQGPAIERQVVPIGADEVPEPLAASDADALNGVWRVVAISGEETDADVEVTMTFATGMVSGTGGCNRYSGDYDLDGETLSLGAIAATRMACPDPQMEVEMAFFAALETVVGYRMTDTGLLLVDAAGEEVVGLSPAASE